jgi:hypothetical protein
MLTFEQGSAERPRGHALFYLRQSTDPDSVLVSYLLILPVSVDLARYVPPFLAQSLGGAMGPGLAGEQNALAWPPIPEAFDGYQRLRALAAARGDDLIFGGTVGAGQVEALVHAAAEAAAEYSELYGRLTMATVDSGAVEEVSNGGGGSEAPSSLDVDEVMYSLLGDRERLSELVKLIGVLRDAVESGNGRTIAEAADGVRRLGRYLAPKFRVDALVEAASTPGDRGRRLAELYVERCYRVVNEDYSGLEDVDARIRSLQASA